MGFNNMNLPDSALAYSEKLFRMKPKHAKNVLIACQMLEQRKEKEKAAEMLDTYLADNKNNNQVWVFASGFYDRAGDGEKAWQLIEEAKKYLPADTLVERQHKYLYQRKFVDPYLEYYNRSVQEMNNKNYASALVYINQFIEKVPGNFDGHQRRAYIYYYQADYRRCIEEVNYALTLKENDGNITNLRGVCYHALNEMESACKDFEAAMKVGNNDGRTNYNRFCKTNPPA